MQQQQPTTESTKPEIIYNDAKARWEVRCLLDSGGLIIHPCASENAARWTARTIIEDQRLLADHTRCNYCGLHADLVGYDHEDGVHETDVCQTCARSLAAQPAGSNTGESQ